MFLQSTFNEHIALLAIFTALVWLLAVLLLPGVILIVLFEAPLGLPFPLAIHIALALGVPVLASLASWRILDHPRRRDRLTLLVLILAIGIELVATLGTLAYQALLRGIGGEPPPPVFLFLADHRHPVILLLAFFTLILTIVDGRACRERARAGDDDAVLQTGITLYGTQRILFGVCLALTSGNAWLAAAIPLACLAGLTIACRDHPASPTGIRGTARAACHRLLRSGQAQPPARENRP